MARKFLTLAIILTTLLLNFSCKSNLKIRFPKGGYGYKKVQTGANNFYQYPLTDSLTKKDSIRLAFFDPQFYPAFGEPNISLYPPKKPIVRFVYESSFIGYAAVLTLIDKKIVVKETVSGFPYSFPDENKLDSSEAIHLSLLQRYYPINKYNANRYFKRYFDSAIKVFPKLIDPDYYLSLMNKAKIEQTQPFTYKTWTLTLPDTTYIRLLELINSSEFWQLSFRDYRCAGEATDADGYSLEVATPMQYQMVTSTPCIQPTKFELACYQLMKVSGLDKSFQLYCERAQKKWSQVDK